MFLGGIRAKVVLAFALGASSPAFATIDLVGATEASFAWQPASGPVTGYLVHQRCTGGSTLTQTVSSNRATLSGQACSSFSVQVAAVGAAGPQQPGPLSDPSETVRLLPAPPPAPPPNPGGGGTSTPPPPPPPEADGGGGTPMPESPELLLHLPSQGRLLRWSIERRGLTGVQLPWLSLSARIVGNGDYNGDGFADLLAVDGGQAFLWLLHDAGPIGGGPLGDPLGTDGSIEGSGDYDGDGVSDVLVRRPAASLVEVWSMDGGEVAAIDALAPEPGPSWRVIGSGDHDGDGRSDVLWKAADGTLVLWRMLERGRFEKPQLAPLPAGWEGVAVGDFDANGCSDVVWRNAQTGELFASLFDAGAPIATQRLEPQRAKTEREIVGSGDFDGDRRTDLLVLLRPASLAIWTLNGLQILKKESLLVLRTGWRTVGVGDESPSTHRWTP
jgi:hypothetical protein